MTEPEDAPRRAGGVDESLRRHGGLSYLQIPARVPRESAAFYERVFGWTPDERTPDDIRFSDVTGHLIGRFAGERSPSPEQGFLPYIYVDDVVEALRQVVAGGGETVEEAKPEDGLILARVRDPAGNLIGIWQAA